MNITRLELIIGGGLSVARFLVVLGMKWRAEDRRVDGVSVLVDITILHASHQFVKLVHSPEPHSKNKQRFKSSGSTSRLRVWSMHADSESLLGSTTRTKKKYRKSDTLS